MSVLHRDNQLLPRLLTSHFDLGLAATNSKYRKQLLAVIRFSQRHSRLGLAARGA
jgi:hypothetical protein